MAGYTGSQNKPGNHHDPNDRRRRRAAPVIRAFCQQHEQRRTGRTDTCTDKAERDNRQRDADLARERLRLLIQRASL